MRLHDVAFALAASVLFAGCAAPSPSIRADVTGMGDPDAGDVVDETAAALDAVADAVASERESLTIDDDGALAVRALLVEAQARALSDLLAVEPAGNEVDVAFLLAADEAQGNVDDLARALAEDGSGATRVEEEAAALGEEIRELEAEFAQESASASEPVTYAYRALLFEDAPHAAAVRALPGEARAEASCEAGGEWAVELSRLDDAALLSSASGVDAVATSVFLNEVTILRVSVAAVAAEAWSVLACDISLSFVSDGEGLALDADSAEAGELEAALLALVRDVQLEVEPGEWELLARSVVLPHVLAHASVASTLLRAHGAASQGLLFDATRQMQETQMSFNLQYLLLQSQMQHENRSYTAISNIMQTKHDTVKNSISNVR